MAFKNLNNEVDFIGIVDMLPPQERRDWNITGDLVQFLAGMGVDQKLGECTTNSQVFSALRKFREMSKTSVLILHFVSHGNEHGIAIKGSSEPFIGWDKLKTYLLDLNQELGGNLIINLTSCFGFHGIQMVKAGDVQLPFYGIIGSEQELTVDDAKKVNRLFYKGMAEGKEIPSIVAEIIGTFGHRVVYGRSAQTQQKIIDPKNSLSL